MSANLKQWESAEKKRSALEASQPHAADDLTNPRNVARYYNPPADTIYPLEYAFHLLGDVRGKTILEYGSGDGVNTVLLANRGAKIIALDLSPELLEIARKRLQAHGIASGVDFVVGSAHNLPLPNDSVDVVFGIAILHHLDLKLSAGEVRRVLKKSGVGIFQEPTRNSRWLRAMRKLIPYQPQDVSPFERPLTDKELQEFATDYSSFRSRPFSLPTSVVLGRLFGRSASKAIHRWDAALLRRLPPLGYYSSVRVIEMTK